MKNISRLLALIMVLSMVCFTALGELPETDLTAVPLKQLNAVTSQIDQVRSAYHETSYSQESRLLDLTKAKAEGYLSGCSGFSWPWFDYTYTRDWDFYTVKTSVTYRNKSNSRVSDDVYAEIVGDKGDYTLAYLKIGKTAAVDNRSIIPASHWNAKPDPVIPESLGFDIAVLTADELSTLKTRVQNEIKKNHTASSSVTSMVESQTKFAVEQHFGAQGISVSWPWFDYSYTNDWGTYTMSTKVDYKSGGSSRSDKVYSVAELVDGTYALTYLSIGDLVLINTRGSAEIGPAAAPAADSSAVTRSVPAGASAAPSVDPASIDYSLFSDEELEAAAAAIKAEQRARIRTKIVMSASELTVAKGKTAKVTAEITDVPDELTASKPVWSTSDKKVATCANGTVTAVNPGTAVITCASTLSDGTEVTGECTVTVIVPVTAVSLSGQTLSLGLNETKNLSAAVRPTNATVQKVTYQSSDTGIVNVDAQGNVTGIGVGTATVTVSSTDGSGVSAKCQVKVIAKSELNMPKTTGDGFTVTLTGMKNANSNVWAKPESGNMFIVIDYTISNDSGSSRSVSYSDFDAYCDGYKLDNTNSIWICSNYNFLEDLASGRKLKGQVCFEVPSNWKQLEIKYDPSAWFSDDLEFMLYK